MKKKFFLKDHLFNEEKVTFLANRISLTYSNFKKDDFISEVLNRFPELELKQRIAWIRTCLKRYLPLKYRAAVQILLKSLPEPLNPELRDNDFGDFIFEPYNNFVAHYGLDKKDLKFSLNAIKKITKRFSGEDAIRFFINEHPKETLYELQKWSRDKHYHVRRLCSEGTRPRLPWSQKINLPITAPLKILDNLYYDCARYVTRSVANHVNDISKVDPLLAIRVLKKWKNSGKQKPFEMEYIIRHALRSLIKEGNNEAIRMLGVTDNPKILISNFKTSKKVLMNTALSFSFDIKAKKDANVLVDYILHFRNKRGELSNKKVFKLKRSNIKAGKSAKFIKRHKLNEHMTTRTLYPGKHKIEIQINGKVLKKTYFNLLKSQNS